MYTRDVVLYSIYRLGSFTIRKQAILRKPTETSAHKQYELGVLMHCISDLLDGNLRVLSTNVVIWREMPGRQKD
jgi:hypothetical protein